MTLDFKVSGFPILSVAWVHEGRGEVTMSLRRRVVELSGVGAQRLSPSASCGTATRDCTSARQSTTWGACRPRANLQCWVRVVIICNKKSTVLII